MTAPPGPLEDAFRIPPDHPSFPGHFPERPILPGAVLLDLVALAARHTVQWEVTGFPSAKFILPVEPGDEIVVAFEATGEGRARFICRRAGETVASGSLAVRATVPEGVKEPL